MNRLLVLVVLLALALLGLGRGAHAHGTVGGAAVGATLATPAVAGHAGEMHSSHEMHGAHGAPAASQSGAATGPHASHAQHGDGDGPHPCGGCLSMCGAAVPSPAPGLALGGAIHAAPSSWPQVDLSATPRTVDRPPTHTA